MWLRLAGGDAALVEVDLHGDPTGHALVDVLVGSGVVEEAARGRLSIARTGAAVDVDRPLSALGLRNGDVLHRFPPPSPTRPVVGPELVVAMGPSAGIHRPVGTGLTVGREAELSLADPGLSREHVRFTVEGGRVVALDLGSLNKTYLFGRPLDAPTPVPFDAPVEAASSIFRLHPSGARPAPELPVSGGVAAFERPRRTIALPPVVHHRIAAPPEPAPPRRVPFAGRPPRGYREHEVAFRAAVENARAALDRAASLEAIHRWAAAPDLADLLRRTDGPAQDLWERRPGDPDHLLVRVGWTDLPSANGYELEDGGSAELRDLAVRTLAPYLVVRCAPLTVQLGEVGGLGVTGPREQTAALARWIVAQLAVLHSPRELRLGAALASRTDWSWFAALPHAAGEEGPMLAIGPDDGRRLIAGLTALVEERAGSPDGRLDGRPALDSTVVLVVDEELALPRSSLATVLERGPALGVHVVWLARSRSTVPWQCRAVVSVAAPTVGVTWTDTGRSVEEASLDVVPLGPIETMAWNLAGLADATERELSGGGPTSAPRAQVLGMGEPTPEEVLRNRDGPGPNAPVPMGPSGEISIGATVGGYLLKRQLGAGGMGAVYLARHRSLPRDVALKVLHPAFADHQQFRERFERESDVLCRLEHPNVVDVIDRGQDGDLLWMSMRYVPGPDLDTALRERGPFAPDAAVAVVAGVARALDSAHDAGLLHRDVKPANVLLRRLPDGSEEAMLTDFGIAKDLAAKVTLTRAGEAPATIAYASPEQLEGRPLDRRADVYSLGAVLFELLTGRRAFAADEIAPLLASVLAGPVPDVRELRPEVSEALAAVVTRALQKEAADRFATCGELVAAARAALDARAPRTTIGLPETPPPPPPRVPRTTPPD